MSLFTESSLCLVPSGVKDGKVYSIKPTDGSGDLTFSRGSDIEATRVNANGYIEKAQVNLLTYSNDFNGAGWSVVSATMTGGQAGYDGTNDAWLFDSTTGYIASSPTVSGVATFSVYAKKGTADGIRLRIDAATDANCYINLNDGTEIISNSGIALSVVSVGSGWYRIALSINDSSISNVRFYVIDNTGISTTGTIYIQDAQVNYGLVAQDYVETTTTSVVSGITNDLPRLDYSGGASCPSLLLEPSRQNLLPTDTYLAGTFSFVNTTATYNNSTSPEGVQNAVLLTQSGTSAADQIYYYGLPTTAGDYAYSFFVKAGTSELCRVRVHDSVNDLYETFNPQTITAGTTAGTLGITFEDYGNGWWRASFSRAVASGAAYHRFWFYPDFNNSNGNVSLYGFQCEAGSYPTSLIPCDGTSATRTAESCSKTGISSLIGQTEGTVYFEVEQSNTSGVNGAWSISDGSSTNRITMNTTNDTSTNFTFSVAANYAGSGTVLMSADATYAGNHKVAIKYSGTSMKLFVDGAEVDSATTTGFGNYTNYYVGANQVGGGASETRNFLQGLLFTSALSDADCITLTT